MRQYTIIYNMAHIEYKIKPKKVTEKWEYNKIQPLRRLRSLGLASGWASGESCDSWSTSRKHQAVYRDILQTERWWRWFCRGSYKTLHADIASQRVLSHVLPSQATHSLTGTTFCWPGKPMPQEVLESPCSFPLKSVHDLHRIFLFAAWQPAVCKKNRVHWAQALLGDVSMSQSLCCSVETD